MGIAVAEDIARRNFAGVRVATDIGDPGMTLDAWAGAQLAVVVEAVLAEPAGDLRRSVRD